MFWTVLWTIPRKWVHSWPTRWTSLCATTAHSYQRKGSPGMSFSLPPPRKWLIPGPPYGRATLWTSTVASCQIPSKNDMTITHPTLMDSDGNPTDALIP